jgi:hypothetical protein
MTIWAKGQSPARGGQIVPAQGKNRKRQNRRAYTTAKDLPLLSAHKAGGPKAAL